MTPSLRKKHRQIWISFALFLPLLFVMAVLVIPKPVYQDDWPTPVEKKQLEKESSDNI